MSTPSSRPQGTAIDLPDEAADRLHADRYGWLTTIAKSGMPVPKLVWFFFDGAGLIVYSEPTAAKVAHIARQPLISLHLDSDANGGGIVVVGGHAALDAEAVDCRDDEPYWNKYREHSAELGVTDEMPAYSLRFRITPTRVWLTPGT